VYSIPITTDAITSEWLTEIFRSTRIIDPDASVVIVENQPIGVGVGIVGQLARLLLQYDRGSPGAPASVVIKLPSHLPENRMVGDHFNFYEREGRFYEEVADKVPVRVPKCFWNHMDPEGNTFALILEDLGDRTCLSQIAGADPVRAAQALVALAGLHATWWSSPFLENLAWMPRLDDPINLSAGEQYRQAWPSFVRLFGDDLPEGSIPLAERIQEQFEELLKAGVVEAPLTICHGDFRLDNLLFDDRVVEDKVAVLDWQVSYRGPAVTDVAYFLCQSLDPSTRQNVEAQLLGNWYKTIVTKVTGEPTAQLEDYPFELVWEQYRRSALGTTVYPVTAGGAMDPGNDRGHELIARMAQRVFSAVIELGSAALLS